MHSYAAEESPSSAVPSVVVSAPKCGQESFSIIAFLDSLRVELAATGLHCCTLAEANAATDGQALHVRIDELAACGEQPERLWLEVRQPNSHKSVGRELSLVDVAVAARPRALALAVAELIRSPTEEVHEETPRPALSAPQRPQSKMKPTEPVQAPSFGYAVQMEGELRAYPSRDTTLWGGRARLSALSTAMHTDVDLGVSLSQVHTDLGELRMRSTSIGFGLGPRLASKAVALDIGPRAELGWAWLSGATSLANVGTNSGSGPLAAVGFRAALATRVHPRIQPMVALEAGGVLRGLNATVDNRTRAGINGVYFLAALGVNVPL
jgi:hypothetical protein